MHISSVLSVHTLVVYIVIKSYLQCCDISQWCWQCVRYDVRCTAFIFEWIFFSFQNEMYGFMKKNEILVARRRRRRSQFVRAFTLEVLFCWEYRLVHVGWLKNATLGATLQFQNYKKVFHYVRMNSNGYVSHTEELQQSVTGRFTVFRMEPFP